MSSDGMLAPLFAWMRKNEDEVFVNIDSMHKKASSLRLSITAHRVCDNTSSRWEIVGSTLREARIIVPTAMHICLTDDHPLLLPFAQPTVELYVSNAPRDPAGLLGDLWLAHREVAGDWIAPGLFLNPGYGPLLNRRSGGLGKLAEGPRPLLEAYAEVARDHDLQPSLLGAPPPPRWAGGQHACEAWRLHVLLLDKSWCIAGHFTCTRMDDAR